MTNPSDRNWSQAARDHGPRMLRFGGVGVANTISDFTVYWLLISVGVTPVAANIASFFAANLQSYFLNARITFRVEGRPSAMSVSAYLKFFAAHAMSLAVSTAMVALLADHIGPLSAKAAAVAFTFVWNYAMSAGFVFARRAGSVNSETDHRP